MDHCLGRLIAVLLVLLPASSHAQQFLKAKVPIQIQTSRGDASGMSLRGGINLHTGQQGSTNQTLLRGQANVGGTCASFDFRASMQEAFEEMPELFTTLATAVVQQLPLLAVCYFRPTECDLAKHLQGLLNALVQAKYAQCQSIQNAMAYAGLRLSGGNISQCLEDATNRGISIQAAMRECNTGGGAFRLPNGTQGLEANFIRDTLAAAGATTETQALAQSLMGEVTMRAGEGRLNVQSQRTPEAMLALYEQHKGRFETDLRGAIEEYQTTGGLSDATLTTLAIPGQPVPPVFVEALASMAGDPARQETAIGKVTTAQALAQLTWDCHELENTLRDAIDSNQNLTDEVRRQTERAYQTLQRRLAQTTEKVLVARDHLQPALDEALRQYTSLQQTAVQAGLQTPGLTLSQGRLSRQSPLGYSQ